MTISSTRTSALLGSIVLIVYRLSQVILLLLGMIAFGAFAGELTAGPLIKHGSCPSGYSSSGSYCVPGTGAKFAVEKVGSCPNGYSTSGNYCVASNNAKHAIQKVGSCPNGYSTSGAYCLSSK